MSEGGEPTSVAAGAARPLTRCDGVAFVRFLAAGTYFLRAYRGIVNDLNVFPVPDGDTGTNMLCTVRQALRAARAAHSRDLSVVAAAAANGSLMGARGNSGVMISQMFRGFAHAVRHRQAIETRDLAAAMHEAVHAARRALVKPVEGTMLSVAAAAAQAAFKAALDEPDFLAVLHAVVNAAHAALEKTPDQLAVLKEADVVDAGGQGFVYFLEGAVRMLPGRAPYRTAFPRRPLRRATFTRRQRVDVHRYCTEFILTGDCLSASELRRQLVERGDSLIVAGDRQALRVHIHTDDPESILSLAGRAGDVSRVKVDDMREQHRMLVVADELRPRGVVCVVPGEGFARICTELGADVTLRGGPGANPAVGELLTAANSVLARTVYLLPNDANTVATARQVPQPADRTVIVVPTRTIAEGIAALFALLEAPAEDAIDPARLGTSLVGSGEIFRAGRASRIGGVAVRRGELVGSFLAAGAELPGLVHGRDAAAIAAAILRAAGESEVTLATLYYGASRSRREAEAVAERLRNLFPRLTVEVYYGGQEATEYVMSLER
jgi:DAK2 domain fusion protein YloV